MTSSHLNGPAAPDLRPLLEEALQTAAAIAGAEMGLLSLWQEEEARLDIGASLGFDEAALATLARVPLGMRASGTCCQERRRVVVEDVEADPLFTPYRELARRARFRAAHATPLVTRAGKVLGALATHFPQPHRLSDRDARLIDLCARQAADAIESARLYCRAQEEIAEHRRAEQALRDSERMLSLICDTCSDCLYLVQVEPGERYRFLSVNEAFLRVSGYDRAQVVDRPMEDVVPAGNHALVRSKYREVCESRRPLVYVETADLPAGRRHGEITLTPVCGPEGEVTHIQGTVKDVTAQKLAEAELAASREQLVSVVETSSDLIGLAALDGRILYFNDAGLRLLGLDSLEEARTKSLFDFVPSDRLPAVQGQMLPTLHAEGRWEGEWCYRHAKTGLPVHVSKKVTLIRDTQTGQPVAFATVSRDLSDRLRAEEELRRGEERLRLALEAGRMGAWDWDIVAGKVTWSNRVAECYGMRPEDFDGRPETFTRKTHPDDEERVAEAIRAAIEDDEPYHIEYRALRPSGEVRWISTSACVLRDGAGRPVRMIGATTDVTERRKVEEELRESEERYRRAAAEAGQAAAANAKFRAFFQQGTNFAGVLSLDGTLVEANRLCLDACGFAREEVIGKPFWECGWWNRSAALMDMVRSASRQAARGQLFRAESLYFVADGSERVVDLILAPVTDEAGRTLFVAATGTDVTERRRMEDTLREADRKKDDFIALLAHELRNPLAPLRNGLQVMRLANDRDVRDQARKMMERQLGHMVRLIDDLLDVSRISRNKMELRRARVALADVVASAVETAGPLIQAEGHELTVSLPAEPLYLNADLTRLAQVFSNLLTNSAKYTPPRGRIGVTAARKGGEVAVSVRDTGIGIPAEALPRIFDMFSQVDRSVERSTGGLGIGLALVSGLVHMHGGTVSVASGQGQGSTFTVTLPVLAADPAPAEETGWLEVKGPGRRVLVVDDNRDGAESLALMLRLLNNEVRTAHDGQEAVEAAEQFRPEIILMDIGMPRLNGLDATRRIRERPWGNTVRVIALTGWGHDNDKERSREAGCDGHLVKPVNLSDLERVLSDVTAARGRGR